MNLNLSNLIFIRGNENVTHFAQSEFSVRNGFLGGNFLLYRSRHSEKVNCHFVNYRLSFRKLQIFISQLQIVISETTDFKPNHPFFSILAFTTPVHFPLYLFRPFFYCNIFYKTRPVATCSHRLPFISSWNNFPSCQQPQRHPGGTSK